MAFANGVRERKYVAERAIDMFVPALASFRGRGGRFTGKKFKTINLD
jgi:hypothetical protein